MNPKKSDIPKKPSGEGAASAPEPADSSSNAEFVPLQNISAESKEGRETQHDGSGKETAEKPFVIYQKNAGEERPILNVRKPAFRPDIKQKKREMSQKARIELPEE